jgi:hypothetical protein
MPITPDKVKELAARGESTKLDYKETDYPWVTAKQYANAELAKDIMAMANILNPLSLPAYILVGVNNNKNIVGIKTAHVDDADLHQKVSSILNKAPDFTYGAVEVDGKSIGVYEIRYSKRPFYPTRDAGSLHENVAQYRDGSSTKQATPDMIVEWAREDDPEAQEVKSLELQKLRAEARVRGQLVSTSIVGVAEYTEITLEVRNFGQCGFTIAAPRWEVEWTDRAREAAERAGRAFGIPDGYVPAGGEVPVTDADTFLGAGATRTLRFKWTYAEAVDHIQRSGLALAGFISNWVMYHCSVLCHGERGGEETLRVTVRP